MEKGIILKAGLRNNMSSLSAIFTLIFIVSLFLSMVLSVWTNAGNYMQNEMTRAGFGALTAWVSDVPNIEVLKEQITELDAVSYIETQNLIFAEYKVNGQESDSEGQLITYELPNDRLVMGRYRLFLDDLSGYQETLQGPEQGQVYVSPSMISMMGLKIGDEITFPIARNGKNISLIVSGFFEDPFMGSSIIGMKGFLISENDHRVIQQIIEESGMDALVRDGMMLHIFEARNSGVTNVELNKRLNDDTELPLYAEFIYSQNTMLSFMLILQNAFCGLLAAFAAVLLVVIIVVLGHSISRMLEQENVNLGILRTIGITGRNLFLLQLIQYLIVILPGMVCGILLAGSAGSLVNSMTLTTTGILIPIKLPIFHCILCFGSILILLVGFMAVKLKKITRITPITAIRGEISKTGWKGVRIYAVSGKLLEGRLAVRQLISEKHRYVSACIVAMLLTFFASVVGRLDVWLGPDGKGMMDAFNPADHDIGVQALGEAKAAQMEVIIHSYTGITDSYLLAMQNVSVEGFNNTANIITEPERFHILNGNTIEGDNEIVLTESAAVDLGVTIGDTLTLRGDKGSYDYEVSGIYQCANNMGNNIGISREGYLNIGRENEHMWCYHYFLEDTSLKAQITETLEETYGGDVHVHENSWPGLFGIISAMQALLVLLYGMVFFFILIVTIMTSGKILSAEQKNLGIYKSIGFSSTRLRVTFTLRFGLIAAIGSVLGLILAAATTDPMVSAAMKFAGISNFSSFPSLSATLVPATVVTLLFVCISYFAAGRIKKLDMTVLVAK